MYKFHDIQQNTDEWMALRTGKLTSSKLGTIMANYGKAFGEPAKKYAVQIAVEQITGKKTESDYSNSHMDRGHEQEPIARMMYEDRTFSEVLNGGFFDLGDAGCSPDGRVGDRGAIEIKSVIPSVHFANIKRQSVDPAYKWQCYGNLKFMDRDWLDFVSYCQDFPEEYQLYTCRIYPDKDIFHMLETRQAEFLDLVSDVKSTIVNAQYFNQ
ncbi:MAG: YqaJ viral recombinase family protein [Planctomycetota bacterium]